VEERLKREKKGNKEWKIEERREKIEERKERVVRKKV
jgi:hypothetical protein